MAHFDVVLDIGIDYGADGGLGWQTGVVRFPSGRTHRNQFREQPIGEWQLGNRNVSAADRDAIDEFLHAMRGRLHSFLYKDWNDYQAEAQTLTVDSGESQLVKIYGASVNPWTRDITKPVAATVVIERYTGGEWVTQVETSDYTLDASTGIVTWVSDPGADPVRWTGEFHVPVRFDRDMLQSQFIGLEVIQSVTERAYLLGPLAVVEEPGA